MTLRKKLLITIACLSVILCTLVTGTIAWLTDTTNPIKNTFVPSDITITLTETPNLDLKMVPGKTITKDPKVTVAAKSEDCWLFVKIEKSANFDDFMSYAMADGWTALTGVDGVYYREVSASDADQIFTVLANDQVTVKESVTKDMMNAVDVADATQPTLSFTAYAIQKANGNNSEFAPKEAWDKLNPKPLT